MLVPSIFGENLFDEDWMTPFDQFEKAFFGNRNPLYGKNAKNMMKTDIHEKDNGYELAIELPGFKKDEINVDVSDGYLTIKAAKGLDKDENDKKGRLIRRERYAGACSRSFFIGDVKPEDVKAKYESGVLTLEVPKAEAKKLPSSSSIAIE